MEGYSFTGFVALVCLGLFAPSVAAPARTHASEEIAPVDHTRVSPDYSMCEREAPGGGALDDKLKDMLKTFIEKVGPYLVNGEDGLRDKAARGLGEFLSTEFVKAEVKACYELEKVRLMVECVARFRDLYSVIEPRSLIVVHVTKMTAMLKAGDFDERLERFKRLVSENSGKTVWEMSLEVSGNDTAKAIDWMMLFVQDGLFNKEIARQMRKAGVLDGLVKLNVITEVRERIRKRPALFAIPSGSRYKEFYHFWETAYLAKELRFRGVSPEVSRFLAVLNGVAYERIVSYALIGIHNTEIMKKGPPYTKGDREKIEAELDHVAHHIALNLRGADFGIHQDTRRVMAEEPLVKMIKDNYRDLYDMLGEFHSGEKAATKDLWKLAIAKVWLKAFAQ